MKKSTLALLLIAVLGIASTFGTVFYFSSVVQKQNQQFNDQQKALAFVVNQYNVLSDNYDQMIAQSKASGTGVQDSLKFSGEISQVTTRLMPDGSRVVIAQGKDHNLETDYGRQIIRNVLAGLNNMQNLTFIGFGNGTAVLTSSTDLPSRVTGCGFDISAGTVYYNNISSFTVQKVATSTCTIVVNTTGLFNTTAGSTGLGFGGSIPNPPSQFQPNDQLTQNYTINQG